MARRLLAFLVLATFATTAAGCACHGRKEWGSGAIGGALVGAAALGTAGGVIANNVSPPFTPQDSDRGVGVAIGLATGAVVGALVGHCLFDPEIEAAAATEPPPAPEPVRKKIVLRGVNFDYDKSTLQAAGRPILDEAATVLGENPSMTVEIRGYTDSRGSDAYNMGLSGRRAETVRKYLVSRGVAADRLTTRGFGESDPVATNDTAEGRAQNRRVELVPR